MSRNSEMTWIKQRLCERVSSVSTRLRQYELRIARDIRRQGFFMLRRGVRATTHSVELWAERNVL